MAWTRWPESRGLTGRNPWNTLLRDTILGCIVRHNRRPSNAHVRDSEWRLIMRDTRPQMMELHQEERAKILALAPLDFDELSNGCVTVRYRALDPVWRETSDSHTMVPLREHIMRLRSVAFDLACEWQVVGEHLRLAASLEDISVNTDLDNDGMWCGPAADFEDANSEVAAKFVAGSIVFNLVWAAYEAAVDGASGDFVERQPWGRGAKGREILRILGKNNHFPHLRQTVFDAFMRGHGHEKDVLGKDMRRVLKEWNIAAIGAERLRCFRNALVHGDIGKPEPKDWGAKSTYSADNDPDIGQFHDSIRIALILIQILMRSTLKADEELSGWQSESQSGMLLLMQLHCKIAHTEGQLNLGLRDAALIDDEDE